MLAETLNPQVRQVVKTYAPGFGLEVVEVPHDGGTIDPAAVRERGGGRRRVIFQQPNVFGILEPAPELAAAANDAGAMAIAHVDPISLGVLEAPGNYGCAMAIGEGRAPATTSPTPARTTASSRRRPSTRAGCRAGSSARRPT